LGKERQTRIHAGAGLQVAKQIALSSDMSLQLAIFIFKNIALQVARKIAPCNMAFSLVND
jgi:hypothetical protein